MRRIVWLAVSVLVCLGPAASPARAQGLPYPSYTPYQIKGIGAEYRDQWLWGQMIGNKTGGVVTNLPWAFIEPVQQTGTCGAGQESYAGYCYTILPGLDSLIQTFSDAGVIVTGILVLPPAWASWPGCTSWCNVNPIYATAFGRFAAYMAHRYNGLNGHGRVANFVVHNEVNAPWAYLIDNCSSCSVSTEVSYYSYSFNAAYDGVKSEQAAAKVFVSLTGYFDGPDNPTPSVGPGVVSLKTYVNTLVPLVGARELQIALHAYSAHYHDPTFSIDDAPQASIGMLGRVTGWLRQAYPSRPSIWEIHLTENGLHGDLNGSGDAVQADWLCKAYQNVLGTPGVESYMYTPATTHVGYDDHEELVYCNLNGAGDCDTSTYGTTWWWRPSWATWALSNRIDVGVTSCGFEVLPYVKLSRYSSPRGHFATTRLPPAGSSYEGAWKLLRYQAPGTHLLYECLAASGVNYSPGGHSFVDGVNPCPSVLTPMGPLGYAYDSPGPGLVALHRCYVWATGWEDHFVQADNCGGTWNDEGILGYVLPF